MGLVYLPTFTIKIKHSWIGKYTVRPMDPIVIGLLDPCIILSRPVTFVWLAGQSAVAIQKTNLGGGFKHFLFSPRSLGK